MICVFTFAAAGCGDDASVPADAGDSRSDAATPTDASGGDAGTDAGEAPEDASTSGCTRVSFTGPWAVERADDVSVGYDHAISPVESGTTGRLLVLFERYVPEAPIGTFTLGEGPNDNYGTCQQCVVASGIDPTLAFFADRGTLTTTVDPYTRRLSGSLTNVRLVEVSVDTFTRESTPVDDGRCIELEDVTFDEVIPPEGWTCDTASYADGAGCHCDCGAWDPDCNSCDPFADPGCEDLPVVDCGADETCAFDPSIANYACVESCDWDGDVPCDTGVCVFDHGDEEADTCVSGPDRVDPAMLGETCTASGFSKGCNVVDGFVQGWCDDELRCQPLCESDSDCTVAGDTCQFFVIGTVPGYCGHPPTDG